MGYTSFDNYMKQRFGGKVYRLSLSTGCTCPNRDGKCGLGGCIFCSEGGSGDFAVGISTSVNAQIEDAKAKVASKLSHSFAGYMAYFQSFTNTYFHDDEEFEGVKAMFFAAAEHPEVVAISIATRPDCLPQYVLDMLSSLNKIKPVLVELGLQTIHEETALLINRGYETSVYDKAVAELHSLGIVVVTHMIIGLPGETEEMMEATLRHIVSVSAAQGAMATGSAPAAITTDSEQGTETAYMPGGIKIQLLHVLKNTRLAEMIENGDVHVHEYSLEEYVTLLSRLIPIVPQKMVVHRITGDPPKNLLISPLWTADKKKVLNTIKTALG